MLETFKSSEQIPAAEKISAAALRYQGKIFTGHSHAHAIQFLERDFPDWRNSGFSVEDGFLTTENRFVTREEALQIAEREQQIEDNRQSTVASGGLDSHDVKGMRRIDWEGE